jgi:phospholipid/cholesterol/gamma-HCH transport system substrate-binding protein
MIARRAALAGLIAAVIVVAYLVITSGGSTYNVKLSLADADGLRQGSPVAIAGQDVGNVSMKIIGQGSHHRVLLTLKINQKDGPLGQGATAAIDSVNLLGQKRVEITKGDVAKPMRSGTVLPQKQVTVSTDLDQVLDVLTPNVRARLAIVINEAGTAMAGRKADISAVLQEFPTDFSDLHSLLSAVADNNHKLGDLVETTNGFVSQLASQNTALENAVDVAGQTAATVASRRADLSRTLADAPATLTSLDGFLGKLKQATVPLGPAARDITATAPKLQDALDQVAPFTQAADPALTEATQDAPELTSLATGATPVLRKATPVLAQLATFSSDLTPISGILDKSSDNLFATLENWSRAIELRDGLSHVFRGEATVSPAEVSSLVDTLASNPVAGTALANLVASIKAGKSSNTVSTKPESSGRGSSGTNPSGSPTPSSSNAPPSRSSGSAGSTPTSAPAPTASTPSTTTSSSSSLGSLLTYLLNK